MLTTLAKIFDKTLNQLKTEIESYSDESDLWKVMEGTTNSAGNLCLHLCGNLQHFIGTILGDTGYVRNRQAEFNSINVPRKEMIETIEKTIAVVKSSLLSLNPPTLKEEYPIRFNENSMTVEYLLFHLLHHFGYHLGQINYHRRNISS